MNNIGPTGLLIVVIYAVIIVVPFFQIWKKSGHSGWLALLMLVPIVNLISIYVLAFKPWPSNSDK